MEDPKCNGGSNQLVSVGGVTYTYDHANRLTNVTQGSNVSTYAYNGDGDRVSQTVNGTTTNYTLDLNAGLTQVLADNTTTYLYGLNRIGQFIGTDSAYFLGDALGSVRQLADSTGAVTLSRSYDPYGNVVISQGSGETAYGYTGEMQQGGLVYLRARYYASGDGRFLSRDTWEGDFQKGMSYNYWLYSYANPLTYVDPSGHNPIIDPFCSIQDSAVCSMGHFFGVSPDYEGIEYVQFYKKSFDDLESYIEENGLHKTTIAAAIAVQSEWIDFPVDRLKKFAYQHRETCANIPVVNKIIDKILNGAGVGYAKSGDYDKYGDLYIMSNSIQAMVNRIAPVVAACESIGGDCSARDKLIIAAMAQNVALQSQNIKGDIKYYYLLGKAINWPGYFASLIPLSEDRPGEGPKSVPDKIYAGINDIRSIGRNNYNGRFQLQLFTQDMLALVSSGWNLPPSIEYSDFDSMMSLALTGDYPKRP